MYRITNTNDHPVTVFAELGETRWVRIPAMGEVESDLPASLVETAPRLVGVTIELVAGTSPAAEPEAPEAAPTAPEEVKAEEPAKREVSVRKVKGGHAVFVNDDRISAPSTKEEAEALAAVTH